MTDSETPPGTPPMPADDVWAEALEGACEAERLEFDRAQGRSCEPLSAAARARALTAFEEVAADEVLAEFLLEALEGGLEAELVIFQRDAGEAPAAADPHFSHEAGPLREAGPLNPSVRAAALAAFDRAAAAPTLQALPGMTGPALGVPGGRLGVRAEPLRARRLAPLLRLRPAAVAALLLVGLGLGLLLARGGGHAEAGLQLRSLARVDTAGAMRMSQVQPRYFAELGHVFVPGRDELLSFRFADDAMIVVGGGDALRVARPGPESPSGTRYDAVLQLESGEARLATLGHPVPLALAGIGLLVLEEGAAHVAIDAAGGVPAVALAERSVARFYRRNGTSVPLAGPTRVLLDVDGLRAFGAAARSLFHELKFFGGPLPQPTSERAVAARLFDVQAGAARRRGHAIQLLGATSDTPAAMTLGWRPTPALSTAAEVRIALRAPSGTRVQLVLTGADAGPSVLVAQAGDEREPGTASVSIALPEGWYERLDGGLLQVRVEVPAAQVPAAQVPAAEVPLPAATPADSATARRGPAVRAWFDGMSLVFRPVDARVAMKNGRTGDRHG